MRTTSAKKLPAGINHITFDQAMFDLFESDITDICRFFLIGKLRSYEKEKDSILSHNNLFVHVVTNRGQFAVKCYVKGTAKKIAIEYALNRILLNHRFPTPAMHAGPNGRPFCTVNGRLTACFSFIKGQTALQRIKKHNTIHQINAAMLKLNNILSAIGGRIAFVKHEALTTTINKTLTENSRAPLPSGQKKIIAAYLLDVCRTYQHHQPLFIRQWLHNHANLCNFLIDKKNVYVIDLEHIKEDYILSDLANLTVTSLFMEIPRTTVKVMVKDYLIQHKRKPEHIIVLNALVKLGLIKEYLKAVWLEQSKDFSRCPPDMAKTYLVHLKTRKEFIAGVLKKMGGGDRFIL